MKITSERMEMGGGTSIMWSEVKTLRMLNDKLALELRDGRVIELTHLHPRLVDSVFRTYDAYVKEHPEASL